MSREIIKENIKTLRKAYNETIEDLAYAIGMSSSSTISQYETGDRSPQPATVEKIANHYSISVYQLTNIKLSANGDFIIKEDDIKMVYNVLFPMGNSVEAQKNEKFKKAYAIHLKLFDNLLESPDYNKLDYRICENLYYESLEDGVEESLVNIIWWWMHNSFYANNAVMFEKGKDLGVKDIIGNKNYLKKYYLYNEEDKFLKPKYSKDDTINDGTDSALMDMITLLKNTDNYSDLADYLMAIKYTYCVMDNGYSKEVNKLIGNEMLEVLKRFNNKYAIAYFKMIKAFFQ